MSFPHKVDIEWLSANGSPADVHLGHVINHIIDELGKYARHSAHPYEDGDVVEALKPSDDDDGTESAKDADREPGTWQQRRRR